MIFYAVIADMQRYLERLMILLTCILVRGQGQMKRFHAIFMKQCESKNRSKLFQRSIDFTGQLLTIF